MASDTASQERSAAPAAFLFGLVLGLVGGCWAGYDTGTERQRNEAWRQGVGRWTTNAYGRPTFEYDKNDKK